MDKRMKVLVVGSAHLLKNNQGEYFSQAIYNNAFFERYLQVFRQMKFIGKVRYVDEVDETKFLKISVPNLEICELPWYQGLRQMFRRLPSLVKVYRRALEGCDCYILRVFQIESFFIYLLRNKKIPYAVEIVNDPEEWSHLSKATRAMLSYILRKMAANANGASYVTEETLQRKYPSRIRLHPEKDKEHYFESHYSSGEISRADISEPKKYPMRLEKVRIVHVANAINNNFKGHKNLILIAERLTKQNHNIDIDFIGDGSCVQEFQEIAHNLKMEKSIHFIGKISNRDKLLERLKTYDMMVLPTYTEGLPRCLLEAFAMGLPCLSTPVGGIPELLPNQYLFDPDDIAAFAEKIHLLMDNGQELEKMSEQNIQTAQKYVKEILNIRRSSFYGKLRDIAADSD